MRVLQTPVRFHPEIGGVESYVYELSTRLSDRGHEVCVLCADAGAGEKHETIDGVDVRRLFAPLAVSNTDVTPTFPLRAVKQARWADVIHTHLPTPWSAEWSALAGVVTGTPVVLTYHNDIVADGMLAAVAQLYNASALKLTLNLVDRVLLTTEQYLDESNALGPYADKAVTVPNGVDIKRFRPRVVSENQAEQLGFQPTRDNLFFLSVLDKYHEYKGLGVLLAAIEQLTTRGETPPHLVVGGDGPRREQYVSTVRERGIDDHVTFAGFVSRENLPLAYNAADVFVLPSLSTDQEGFGLVLLEALACETPVVTTDVVGIAREVRQNNLGRVVKPGDQTALTDAIQAVLAEPPDVTTGRELCIERYSWNKSVDDLLDIYETVVGTPK